MEHGNAALMIRVASPFRRPPQSHRVSQPHGEIASPPDAGRTAYDLPFWLAYTSYMLAVAAVAILFRYADFVALLGGTELELGWIVGVGTVGSLTMQFTLGSCIDHYGTRVVWLGSTLLLIVACFGHLAISNHAGVAIYLARIMFSGGIAGFAGAAMTFVSGRAPAHRSAELASMLGTAGFVGTVLGAVLGDLLLSSVAVDRAQVVRMFVTAGVLGICSLPFAWLASRSERRPEPRPHSPWFETLRKYHPGAVLAVGVAMGMGANLPCVFLRTYAAELSIPRIGPFFAAFSVATITGRILSRRWSDRFGSRPLILLGMTGMAASMAMFVLARSEWLLVLPGIGLGASYSILFAPVLADGVAAFPATHRGMATLLILSTFDFGQLVGAPIAGAVLEYSPLAGLPPYPTMFFTVAALLALVGAWYTWRRGATCRYVET
jgi:MFS family permease